LREDGRHESAGLHFESVCADDVAHVTIVTAVESPLIEDGHYHGNYAHYYLLVLDLPKRDRD
jgi:hypothetical protein